MRGALALEESLKEALLENNPPVRAMKAIADARRPRLVANESVPVGTSLKTDFEQIEALLKDDEPCVVVVRVNDEAKTLQEVGPDDVILITWLPQSVPEARRKEWSSSSGTFIEVLSPPLRVKYLEATERSHLTWEAFKTKCDEFAMVDETGSCNCGACKFGVKGKPLMGALIDHGKDCSRASGAYPCHMVAVAKGAFIWIQGEELSKQAASKTSVTNTFCRECGTALFQDRADEPAMRIVFPTTFQIEDGVSCKLPKMLMPTVHVNYESRQWDWKDDLPKFKSKMGGSRLTNTGEPIAA